MATKRLQKLNILQVLYYCLVGIVLGIVYTVLEGGIGLAYKFYNGISIGFFLGLLIGTLEVYVFNPRFKQTSFALKLFIRVMTYAICIISIILIVVTVSRAARNDKSFFEALMSEESLEYIFRGDFKIASLFTLLVSLIANFTRLMSFKIGRGILSDFFLGVYHKPKLTERLFVFIRIQNADKVLRHNPVEVYHSFLNEVYSELSIALMHHKGYVYNYIDNEVIVYWKGVSGNQVKGIMDFYQEVLTMLKEKSDRFNQAYSIQPQLQWAAHGGKVIQAEIGELKTEIAFQGDVLNSVSRMLTIGSERREEFVLSDFIFSRLTNSENIVLEFLGDIVLRGKTQPVSLYSIKHVTV